MYFEEVKEMLGRMTDEELNALSDSIAAQKSERIRNKQTQALSELVEVIEKWKDEHISFYVHDDFEHQITLYPNEICVDSGWIQWNTLRI